MNLYERIVDMYKNESREWNYYDEKMSTPFNSIKAKEFIKQYFEYGAKKGVIMPFIDGMESMRLVHMTSVFFIGLLIKKSLCPTLNIKSQNSDDYEFSYLWFLVCLFHDMGYVIESDWTYKFTYRKNSEEYLRQYKAVRGRWWRQRYEYDDLGLIYVAPLRFYPCILFSNGVKISRAMYSRKTVLNYLEYCKMTEGIRHYDHGIVGGLWLYDSLMRNYHKMYMSEKANNQNIDFRDFQLNGYWHFSEEQRTVFAYLANCIISHNIWPASEETYEAYERCGLEELAGSRFKKIAFSDNPILFILAIADTIEPIKVYSTDLQMSEVEIWSGMDMIFEKERTTIRLLDDRLPFEKLENKIKGLDNWMDVKILSCSNERKVEIEYE